MTLGMASVILGSLLMLGGLAMTAAPRAARRALLAFPRSDPAALLLTAAAFGWALAIGRGIPMGRFAWARDILALLLVLIAVLVYLLNRDLLAARALGGLLVLAPAPLLALARWHDSSWRYVVIVVAYGMVVKGVTLIMLPYMFRKSVAWAMPTPVHTRVCGSSWLGLGVLLIGLGAAVY